ncbi:hypothetical protein, partial [Dechloromonas sp. ZS-1]|uniref:hypothetical protein n=1 Tax=Dechloromonas sp. ZS-1 TaxID=3138067 RepID=UPI0031FC1F16
MAEMLTLGSIYRALARGFNRWQKGVDSLFWVYIMRPSSLQQGDPGGSEGEVKCEFYGFVSGFRESGLFSKVIDKDFETCRMR